jgi:mannose-6-phosphate isomerase-like protein (cupin superfamily)
MSDYTLTNFTDIEDRAAESGGKLEARFARSAIESEHLGVTLMRYTPGHRMTFGHRHRVQEEAYIITSGSCRVRLDGEDVELKRWDVLRVAPSVARGFEAGPDGLEMIVVGSDRPEEGDGERIEGFWEG